MMPLWTSEEISHVTGGVASGAWHVAAVDIDSRDCVHDSLFFALKGEATDGHAFLKNAYDHGARAAMISDITALDDPARPHVLVKDTSAALNAMAKAARGRTNAKIIAVTGSAGKTGVKEALRLGLDRYRPNEVHASIKSFNNHVGVPLTLARMPAAMRYAVLEMGMNHAGELTALSALGQPHVAIITTIASAHRAFFDSEDAIADAKGEICSGIMPGGTIILNADSPHYNRLRAIAEKSRAGHIMAFGVAKHANVRALETALHPTSSTVTADVAGERMMFKVGQPGAHWVSNALSVLAAVKAVDADLALAGLALAEMSGLAGRGRRSSLSTADGGEALLLDESYNANPASMVAALSVLGGLDLKHGGRRIAMLADMKEMGEHSRNLHAGLASAVEAAGVSHVICVGEDIQALAAALPASIVRMAVANSASAFEAIGTLLRGDDVLLVKGSNSMGLGKVVERLIAADHIRGEHHAIISG
jgi:UDP-N-acetylmuramoyl-tripeptide--D-alanyl-D-alanine ligase